ncbi:MAG: hypothetical protein AAB466_11025, partial [Verrucomicrobiota bacterium]
EACAGAAADKNVGAPLVAALPRYAVSQGFQPAGLGQIERFGPFLAPADWKSAIQQVGNLLRDWRRLRKIS